MFLAESNDEMFLVGKLGVQKIEMENRRFCWVRGALCGAVVFLRDVSIIPTVSES